MRERKTGTVYLVGVEKPQQNTQEYRYLGKSNEIRPIVETNGNLELWCTLSGLLLDYAIFVLWHTEANVRVISTNVERK